MWAFLLVVIMVCGYYYIDNHLPSKYKQNKATGWNAYFYVALKGAEFLIQGIIVSFTILIFAYLIMFIMNIPSYFCPYEKFTFVDDMLDKRFFSLSFLSCLIIALAASISYGSTSNIIKRNKNPEKRIKDFIEVAKQDPIESILLEAWTQGKLLLVTLKSRKVYVGFVDGQRFENTWNTALVLIPYLSGYRHKDTLTFIVEHNYALHYEENGLDENSTPSINDFRHVLPLEQIESLSLFNIETFISFHENKTEQ